MSDNNDNENLPAGAIARWIPTVVVLTSIAGFVTLAWYAYHAGTRSINEESLLVVEADKSPMKEKPSDPGGMQFPNQDKIIFEAFSGNEQSPPKVERLLPAPEEPMKPAGNDTTTWVNQKLHKTEPEEPKKASAPEKSPLPESPKAAKEDFALEAAVDKGPAEPAAPATDTITSYTQPKKAEAEPPAKAEAALDTAVKPAKVASAGKAKAQLGAYGSEKEAKAAWASMQKKYDALDGRDYVIVKADLGAKGTFYRLRVTGFANTTDAKTFCGKLSAKGQACIPVAE